MEYLSTRLRAGLCAFVCFSASLSAASAHGDHSGGADGTVLPPGVTLVTLQYDYVSYRPIDDGKLSALAAGGVEGVHSLRTIAVPSLSVSRGLTTDFTVTARLPYLANSEIRETDVDSGGVAARGGVYGFGDASLLGTYRFFNDRVSGVDASVTVGVKAPTGRTNAVDQIGVLFETDHQPGSGSWDGLFGVSLNKQIGLWSFGANTLFTRAGAGSQDTRLGDRMSYGVSAAYRLWANTSNHDHAMHVGADFDGMMRHGGVTHPAAPVQSSMALDASLGLNGSWSSAQTIAGERDGNTGGNVVFLTPGLRMTVDKWSSFVSVGIPVARQLNGIQSDPRLQVTSGLSVKF